MDFNKNSKFFIAGHTGMVGSAITRQIKKEGYNNLILKTHSELELLNQQAVKSFYEQNQPEYVFICAAKVGGIHANNTLGAQFIYENMQIQNNLIHYAHEVGVKKLLFFGSSCIYPRDCNQPIKEESLLKGPLEKTNEAYAIAKIAGIKMCENYYKQYGSLFFSIMPTNTYGPNDNYNLKSSHVLPALIRKIHEAKINKSKNVVLWGTGKALREFIYADDLASAATFIMNQEFGDLYNIGLSHLNVGTGIEISIRDLALLISRKLNYKGMIEYDHSKPDGTPRKTLDSSRLNDLGWEAIISLEIGIELTYNLFLDEHDRK